MTKNIQRPRTHPNYIIIGFGVILLCSCAAILLPEIQAVRLKVPRLGWIPALSQSFSKEDLGGAVLISILFGTIGLACIWTSISMFLEDTEWDTLRLEYPEEPWMWKKKWLTERQVSQNQSYIFGAIGFTIVVSMLAIGSFLSILKGLPEGNFWVLLGLLPIGLAFALGIRTYRQWRSMRFEKHMSFMLVTRPVILGDSLRGKLVIPTRFNVEDLKVTLERMKIVTTRDSEGTTVSKKIEHQVIGQILKSQSTDEQNIIHIKADAPVTQIETSWGKDDNENYWEFELDMRVNGRRVFMRYEVPVVDIRKHPVLNR